MAHPQILQTATQIRNFIFAGKATFTIENQRTGNRYTFKMKAVKKNKKVNPNVCFVSVLRGPSNTSSYGFLGTVFSKTRFQYSPKSTVGASATSVKVMEWLLGNIETLPSYITVWHEGKCGRCGRKLTVPESIISGLGPKCEGLV